MMKQCHLHHGRVLKHHIPLVRNAVTVANSVDEPSDATIAKQVLSSSEAQTLSKALSDPKIQWTPQLVNKILKRLWNHGPKALQFFKHLDRHNLSYTHSSSSFDHAIDIAARMRDYNTCWALLGRMRSLRLGPTPKTLSILAERYAANGKPHRAVKLFLNMHHHHDCHQTLHSFNTFLDILSGKVGGFIASIPDVMVAGLLCFMWAMVTALGLSNLHYNEAGSSRNIIIVGLSLFLSLSIPAYFQQYGVSPSSNLSVPSYFQPYVVASCGPFHSKYGGNYKY